MSKPLSVFKDIAGMVHFNNYLRAFHLELIGDHCFRVIFAVAFFKISKKVILAQMNWKGNAD